MKRPFLAAALGLASLVVATMTGVTGAQASNGNSALHAHHACSAATAGHAACTAVGLYTANGKPLAGTTPPATALTPTQLQSAYKLTGLKSGGKTVAIVDAYGYTNLERDLGVFRSYYGLSACTTANGCLRVINETGGTSLPSMNTGWAQEQALDVQTVSAACPDCKIVVVEASSTSFADLGTAVNTAAKQPGVVAISNSYGGGDAPDSTYGSYYNHAGIAVTASTGDNGYQGGSFPADSSYVTAVGGTTLKAASGTTRGWTESAWSGSGAGCSTYNTQPSFQTTAMTGCSKRAMADVSAAADPNYGGIGIYYPTNRTTSTWGQWGGTSEASPIIASVYALGTNSLSGYPNALPYAHTGSLFDVTSGNDGTCPTTVWCTSGTGWDGPTGLGTPNGAGAF